MMLSILERMNPAECLGGRLSLIYDNPKDDDDIAGNNSDIRATAPGSNDFQKLLDNDDDDYENITFILTSLRRTVPDLLECICKVLLKEEAVVHEKEKENRVVVSSCASALQSLHDLTTKENEQNRVPMVCNNEPWDVVDVLSRALLASTITEELEEEDAPKKGKGGGNNKPSVDENRRLILWTLNNLSIPYENKASMASSLEPKNNSSSNNNNNNNNNNKLLHALTRIIELNLPESYLCCICLLNLTFTSHVIRNVTLYVPPEPPTLNNKMRFARSQTVTCSTPNKSYKKFPTNNDIISPVHSRVRSLDMSSRKGMNSGKKKFSFGMISSGGGIDGEGKMISNALGNSSSLIRVVEQMMIVNTPFLLSSSVRSVQGEAIRWSCGFIRNVTSVGGGGGGGVGGESNNLGMIDNVDQQKNDGTLSSSNNNEPSEEICLLLSHTEIPRLMAQYVKDSPRPIIEWTKDSLEDMCLGAMCNMAQWQSTRQALWLAGASQGLKKLEECPGIHGYRARAIRCSLGVSQSRFR